MGRTVEPLKEPPDSCKRASFVPCEARYPTLKVHQPHRKLTEEVFGEGNGQSADVQ